MRFQLNLKICVHLKQYKKRKMKLPPVIVEESCVNITDDLWERILHLYLRTYRGPNADVELKNELADYKVLKKDPNAKIEPGRYIRYMSRGIIDSELRRGGYVVKCSSKSVHLQDGRRHWRVSRIENYIFVRNEDAPIYRKTMIRLLAEEAIRRDNEKKQPLAGAPVPVQAPQDPEPPRIKLRAQFL
jgi:hypothetical protein